MAAARASASSSGESIYNWIKEAPSAASKPAMYRSKFNPKAVPSYSTIRAAKKKTGVIGKSVKETIDPKAFLKAGSKMGKGVTPATSKGEGPS